MSGQSGKNIILHIAIYTSTVSVLYFLLKLAGIDAVTDEFAKADLLYIVYASLLSMLFAVLSGLKLKMFVKMMGYEIGWIRCQKITFATYPLNVMLPSKGGDFVKSWALKGIMPVSQGIGLVILERLIDLSLLCLISFAGSLWMNDSKLLTLSLTAFLMGVSAIFILHKTNILNYNNRLFRHIEAVGHATRTLVHNRKYFLLISATGIFIWVGSAFQVFLLYSAVGQYTPLTFNIAVVPIAILIGILPITLAGMGTRDIALVYLFSAYSTDSASISVGLLFSVLRYWLLALMGIPFLSALKNISDNTLNSIIKSS